MVEMELKLHEVLMSVLGGGKWSSAHDSVPRYKRQEFVYESKAQGNILLIDKQTAWKLTPVAQQTVIRWPTELLPWKISETNLSINRSVR